MRLLKAECETNRIFLLALQELPLVLTNKIYRFGQAEEGKQE
jgi:hypothetical protein